MSDSVRPHRWQPTRLPFPQDSPGKNTGVGCHFLLRCRKVKSESEVAQSCLALATPWTVACETPLSMGFSRQECWSGLPFPSPGDFPRIPHASWPKHQNIKQKQYCNKFNKDFKNGPHSKKKMVFCQPRVPRTEGS